MYDVCVMWCIILICDICICMIWCDVQGMNVYDDARDNDNNNNNDDESEDDDGW